MKRYVPVLLMVALCSVSGALAEGNANFVLGGRWLDEDFWQPVEDQGVIGVTVDFGRKSWPIHLAVGTHFSGAKEDVDLSGLGFSGNADFTGGVGELSFGVLKVWTPSGSKVRPYVGGGLAVVTATAELEVPGDDLDDDDTSGAVYAQGGVFWRLGKRFNIGIDARILGGTDIELFGASGDADYIQAGLVLGWGWD